MCNKNLINNFTIVIPTFNRHNYLKRILEYYQKYDINIKIFDSSIDVFDSDILLKSNIEYIHLPNLQPLDKIIYALEYTNTKYIVLCADDDFIFIDAIRKCCDFLDKNDNYVCAQGKLISFKYRAKDDGLEYMIESYFKTSKNNSYSNNIKNRLFNFSKPYRHTFYGVHRSTNILYIYKLIKQYKLTEPFLVEFTQALLLILSGKVLTFDKHIYHLREMMKTTASHKYKDIPTLVKMNHPEISIVKGIIVKQLIQKYNIFYDIAIEISENIFKEFCDFIQEKRNNSQKFHKISLDKNTNNVYDNKILQELYLQESDLKLAEGLILKHKICSGFAYQENEELKSFSKNILGINQIIKKLKVQIKSSDKVLIYGAGNFATLLIEIFNSQIEFIIDKNEDLVGHNLKNKPIKSINILYENDLDYDVIIVSVLGRNDEIIDYLSQFKLNKVIHFC